MDGGLEAKETATNLFFFLLSALLVVSTEQGGNVASWLSDSVLWGESR